MGEMNILNYRISKPFVPPFKLMTFLTMENKYKLNLNIKLKSNLPENSNASNILVSFNITECSSSVYFG